MKKDECGGRFAMARSCCMRGRFFPFFLELERDWTWMGKSMGVEIEDVEDVGDVKDENGDG